MNARSHNRRNAPRKLAPVAQGAGAAAEVSRIAREAVTQAQKGQREKLAAIGAGLVGAVRLAADQHANPLAQTAMRLASRDLDKTLRAQGLKHLKPCNLSDAFAAARGCDALRELLEATK